MAIQVEHELHTRRRSRNVGLGLLLISFVVLVFGLTVVKVRGLDGIIKLEASDQLSSPQIYSSPGEDNQ